MFTGITPSNKRNNSIVLLSRLSSMMEGISLTGIIFSLVILLFTLVLYKTGLISKICDAICESSLYKKWFVLVTKIETENTKSSDTFLEVSKPMFKEIEDKAIEIGGDVLEIGAGTGRCLHLLRLPEESSLVVVDYNPFMEKHFRENLAKAPHIKLKDYLVQSAADMSNIPDNNFAAVFLIDVMCSLEEEMLKKMLKEIKRVLKPGGCFYFIEHVLDEPGTLRRMLQKFFSSQTGIWPRLFDGCLLDRETGKYIRETGFDEVILNYSHLPPLKIKNPIMHQLTLLTVYLPNYFMTGHAKK